MNKQNRPTYKPPPLSQRRLLKDRSWFYRHPRFTQVLAGVVTLTAIFYVPIRNTIYGQPEWARQLVADED